MGVPTAQRPSTAPSGTQYHVADSRASETRASSPYASRANGLRNGDDSSMVMTSAARLAFSSTPRHAHAPRGTTTGSGAASRLAVSDSITESNGLVQNAASASPLIAAGVISGCVVVRTSTVVSDDTPSSCSRPQNTSSTARGISVNFGGGGGAGAEAHEASISPTANRQPPTANLLTPASTAACSSPRRTRGSRLP